MMASRFPHASHSSHIPSMLPSITASCFWLVVLFWSAGWGPINPTVYFIFTIFALLHSTSQIFGTAFPHALRPPCTTSQDSLLPLMPTLGWLLCFPFKFWLLNAKAMPIILFFDGVCAGVPNKGTGHGTAKPDHRQLAWDNRRLRCHVLVVPLSYPWRGREKLLGDRVAASHVGRCCVFCVLCFVLDHTFS